MTDPTNRPRRTRRRLLQGSAAAAAVSIGIASALHPSAAGADPKQEAFELACDNGENYTVVANGNGEYTPALATGSNTVLVPVSFGAFTGTLTPSDGSDPLLINDPPVAKGSSANSGKNLVTCTFEFTFVNTESQPGFPAGTFIGGGTAVVKVVPGR